MLGIARQGCFCVRIPGAMSHNREIFCDKNGIINRFILITESYLLKPSALNAKQIDKHLMKINRMTDRVKQEADIHRRLSHPAVLQLYRFFEDQNYIYLVLELAKHGDIQNYLSANNIVNTL